MAITKTKISYTTNINVRLEISRSKKLDKIKKSLKNYSCESHNFVEDSYGRDHLLISFRSSFWQKRNSVELIEAIHKIDPKCAAHVQMQENFSATY